MMMLFSFSPTFGSDVLANDSKIVEENLNQNLNVKILDNGKIAPIEEYSELNEEELNLILERIGYSPNFFKSWDINRKRKYVSYGGKVLKGSLDSFKSEYISDDGKSYEIDSTNIDEIREMQLQDLKDKGIKDSDMEKFNVIDQDKYPYTGETSFKSASDGAIQDGIWGAHMTVTDIGETGTQHKYVVSMEYAWSEQPLANYNDHAGLHWGSYGSPVADTAIGSHTVNYAGEWLNFDHNLDLSSNYGTTSTFGYPDRIGGEQFGYLDQEIWVSKDYTGQQLSISGAYTHPWFPNNWSLSASIGGLSLDSTFEDLGNHWTWRYNFTP